MEKEGLSLSQGIAQFLVYLQVERGFAPSTVAAYQSHLKAFTAFAAKELGDTPSVDKVTLPILRRYLAGHTHHQGPKARADVISHLQAFYKFLVKEGVLSNNPAAVLVKPKGEKRLPVYLTVEECRRLLAAIDEHSPYPQLEGGVIRLMLYTGIRLGELLGLTLADINLEAKYLKVKGKGSKERLIPLSTMAMEAITAYLITRPQTELAAFFLIKKGPQHRPLKGPDVQAVVRKYVTMAGITYKRVTPHVFRHTFATLLYANEVGLIELKELLGHVKLVTTEVYTHVTSAQLKQAIASHPLKEEEENYQA